MKIHLEIHLDRTPGYDYDQDASPLPPLVLSVDSGMHTVVHTLQAFLENAGLPTALPWQEKIRDLCEQNRLSSKTIDRMSGEIRDLENAALTARKLLGEVLDKGNGHRVSVNARAQLKLAVTALCGGVEGLEIIRPPTGN